VSYEPWKGTLPDGTEVLVTVQHFMFAPGHGADLVPRTSVEVAFRAKPHHTWGPPTTLERAP
jgi:hypothetical protein